jgi:Skp family chaperone for outer membrane proteins
VTVRVRPFAVRLAVAGALVFAVTVAGCRPRAAAPPPPPVTPEARQARIGIVDFEAVIRAHSRWAELQEITTAMQRVEMEMAAATTVAPPQPASVITPAALKKTLDEEAAALKRSIEQQLAARRAESRRRLDALAAQLRTEQQRKFEAASKQMTDEAEAALDAKGEELQAKLRTGELAIMEEYSYPILNLRLRAEVAGLRSEDEARQILRQIQLLQSERESRVADLRETLREEFDAFKDTKEAEVNDRLKALQETLNKELQEQLAAKEAELAAELAKTAAERQAQFERQMAERQRQLITTAESQLRSQQRAVVSGVGERLQRLQAQRVALLEQRQRLEETILADVRIEVAALAALQGIDTVLTRLVVNISGQDITTDVIQRLKQR